MRKILLFAFVVMSIHVSAQQAEEIVFSEETFDFGTIREADGPVIHEFSFTNNGLDTMNVVSVRASCGCTTPKWTKEAVPPGGVGIIQAQYNPRNRPGTFNKSLTINASSSKQPYKLYIKGHVVPQAQAVEDELRTQMGVLRLKYRSLNMGKVKTTDEPGTKQFDVYNASNGEVAFSDQMLAPAHIKLNFEPKVLSAKSRGKVIISYDAKLRGDLGFMNDNVTFYTNEQGEDSVKSISIYATIEEYFPPMSKEELDKAPKLKIADAVHDYGRIKPDKSLSTEFVLVNNGQSNLNIRKAKGNCSCVSADLKKTSLKPGESTKLKVKFNPEGRKGNQQKSITVYSDDPLAPAQRVTIKAYIETGSL